MWQRLGSARRRPAGSLLLAETPRPPPLEAFGIFDGSSRSRPQTPPPLRSTVTGPLLSSVSSADFSRMARRLSDTCPFFTALISCTGHNTRRVSPAFCLPRRSPADHRQITDRSLSDHERSPITVRSPPTAHRQKAGNRHRPRV